MINDIWTSGNEYEKGYEIHDFITYNPVQYINTSVPISKTSFEINKDVLNCYHSNYPGITLKLRAWNKNVEMIPCIEKATNRTGFWDTVDERFWEVNEFLNSFSKNATWTFR